MTDDGTDGPTEQDLHELLDAERHRRLVDERRRRHRADEVLTLGDVLGALAAHRAEVTVHTTARTLPPGYVCEVGRDYVALRSDAGSVRLVPLDRITWATPTPLGETRSVRGPDPAPDDGLPTLVLLDLAERLRELVGLHARMQVSAGGVPLSGLLRRAGADVVILEDDDGADQFVALQAVDDVVVALR